MHPELANAAVSRKEKEQVSDLVVQELHLIKNEGTIQSVLQINLGQVAIVGLLVRVVVDLVHLLLRDGLINRNV